MERVLEVDETEDGLQLVVSVRQSSYDMKEGVDLGRRRPGTISSHNVHCSVVDYPNEMAQSGFQVVYCRGCSDDVYWLCRDSFVSLSRSYRQKTVTNSAVYRDYFCHYRVVESVSSSYRWLYFQWCIGYCVPTN